MLIVTDGETTIGIADQHAEFWAERGFTPAAAEPAKPRRATRRKTAKEADSE